MVQTVSPFQGRLAGRGRLMPRLRDALEQTPGLARRLQRHVLEAAEELRPDLVLNVDYRLAYPIVAGLRALTGAPVAFWFPDSPGNVRKETYLFAGYDALFFKDSVMVERYRKTLGLNAHFLPQGCNPRWHRPVGPLAGPARPPSVVVAGNMYATRFVLVEELVRRGLDVKVWGSSWSRWLPANERVRAGYQGRPVFREEKARTFRSASVVLNNVASHEGDGLNTRLFEAAACGSIVLSEFRARLPEFFEIGSEVSAYEDLDGLERTARELSEMSHADREKMAAAASQRAHADHSYGRRFEQLLATLGKG